MSSLTIPSQSNLPDKLSHLINKHNALTNQLLIKYYNTNQITTKSSSIANKTDKTINDKKVANIPDSSPASDNVNSTAINKRDLDDNNSAESIEWHAPWQLYRVISGHSGKYCLSSQLAIEILIITSFLLISILYFIIYRLGEQSVN
jgi:hypothetical protein